MWRKLMAGAKLRRLSATPMPPLILQAQHGRFLHEGAGRLAERVAALCAVPDGLSASATPLMQRDVLRDGTQRLVIRPDGSSKLRHPWTIPN